VHQRDDRLDAVCPAAGDDLAVVLDLIFVEAAFFRFDARPLDGESIGVQSGLGQELNVLFIAMIVVAGCSAGLCKAGMGEQLLRPLVAVNIAAFHLMGGSRRTDEKSFGE
jgi:hypothetical protein